MLLNAVLVALAASSLVAAHGKVTRVVGDSGGETSALGIVPGTPGAGRNKDTETDTTTFRQKAALSDGLGKTTGGGPNTLEDLSTTMKSSGSTFPQATAGGNLTGTLHIVTTDGAGPYTFIVDPTGTGAFSTGTELDVLTQVPGRNGNIQAPRERRFLARMLVKMGIMKRAANVNEDYPFAAAVPADTTCTGTIGGQSNVCLLKIVNPSRAGPFGGVVPFQMAAAAPPPAPPAAAPPSPATPGVFSNTSSLSNTSSAVEKTTGLRDGAVVKLVGAKFRA